MVKVRLGHMTEQESMSAGKKIADLLGEHVFAPLRVSILRNPSLRNTLHPAFPFPREVRIGFLDDSLVVEFVGPEAPDEEQFELVISYSPGVKVMEYLGVDLSEVMCNSVPCSESIENLRIFLGSALVKLCDYFYDFTQMPNDQLVGAYLDFSQAKNPLTVSNTSIYWTTKDEQLKVRHIDMLHFVPVSENGWGYYNECALKEFKMQLEQSIFPKYEMRLHKALNDFIEFIETDHSEPEITAYLESNPEILQLSFGAHRLNPQTELIWQSESGRQNLKPDFMPQRMDGFADILEFKLPRLKARPIVGGENREQPSHEVDAAIAQIHTYQEWCEQKVNCSWLEAEKGIKLGHPRGILVIGHSSEFSAADRQKISKTRNITVYTYDEFIEMARSQLYRVR